MQLGKNAVDFTRRGRKLKLQIRQSPNGKTKDARKVTKVPKVPKGKRPTGVSGSRQEFPQSTNVSSPIQAASRRRIAQYGRSGPEVALHSNGYARDDFVISDHDGEASNVTDDDEYDAFEEVREAGKPQKTKRRELGPPITIDEKLEKLNSTHRMMVEDFMWHAKKINENVSPR